MTPRCGPVLYSLPAFANVSIGAGLSVGPSKFRWPRRVFFNGFLLVPQSGNMADLAKLKVKIQDATYQDLITDGQGSTFNAPGGALHGIGVDLVSWPLERFFPMQAPIEAGDEWFFTVQNADVAPIVIAALLLRFEDMA